MISSFSADLLLASNSSSAILGPINTNKSRITVHPTTTGQSSSNKQLDYSKPVEHEKRHPSPAKGKRNVVRGEQVAKEKDTLPQTQSKIGPNPMIIGSANMRRSRNDSFNSHPYPSISSNSVEYSEVQDLNPSLPPTSRSSSGPRRQISPGHPTDGISITHSSTVGSSSHLITASLSLGDSVSLAPAGPKIFPNNYYGDEMGDSPSKPTKMDATVTPVRISKKELKRIAKNEINNRKNSLSSLGDNVNGQRQQGALGVSSNSQVGLVQDFLREFS